MEPQPWASSTRGQVDLVKTGIRTGSPKKLNRARSTTWGHAALAAVLAASASPPPEVAAQTASPPPLEWMAGCWEMATERSTTTERWSDAAGGVLLGSSKTMREGRVAAWELLRIQGAGDGSWQYWAYPSGQTPTTFAATSANADSVTFENPEHDFPQSITYRRRPDSLVASIQGESSSGYRQIFFAYRRIPCEAPNPG